jgi:hypothetical protein
VDKATKISGASGDRCMHWPSAGRQAELGEEGSGRSSSGTVAEELEGGGRCSPAATASSVEEHVRPD